jgi:hypothetical protein
MADQLGVLLTRLEVDLPGDAPSPARLRTLGDRRRLRRRAVAVVVPVLLLALLGGWLLAPDPDASSHPVINPAPRGEVFNGRLQGWNTSVAVTAQLPIGWRAAAHPAFDVDLRNADGTRGVAIMVYPGSHQQGFRSLVQAEHIASAATGQNLEPTRTEFAGQPARQFDAVARPGATLSPGCIVFPRCQPLFRAWLYRAWNPPKPGFVGLLPHRSTRMIFTNTPLGSVVWVWTTRPGDLPATLAEVQPMFDTLDLHFRGAKP